jgi:hypothetical protein
MSDATSEHQKHKDEQHKSQASAGKVPPISAVRPSGDDTQQHEKEKNQDEVEQH